MINIKITLEATSSLEKFLNKNELTLDNRENNTILSVINALEIPLSEIGFATINGKKMGFDDLVHEGDVVKFYTKIIAG